MLTKKDPLSSKKDSDNLLRVASSHDDDERAGILKEIDSKFTPLEIKAERYQINKR